MCLQVAGLANDLSIFQQAMHRDGIMVSQSTVGALVTPDFPIGKLNDMASTLLNYPYRLSFSKYKGSIYVADYFNRAVRRFLVQPQCACADGYVALPEANSCYNPSPLWAARQLPHCAPGFFALEGEVDCLHPCTEAAVLGVAGSVACDASSSNSKVSIATL